MATSTRADTAHRSETVRSDILDRLPPQNLDAEKGVIGSLLLDPMLCDDVLLIVRPEDFYADANRKLFDHMVQMHNGGVRIDVTLLVERLKAAGDLEAIGGMAYLAEVAQIRRRRRPRRQVRRDRPRQGHAPRVDPREHRDPSRRLRRRRASRSNCVGQAEQKIFTINDRRSADQIVGIHDVLMETFDLFDHRMEHGGAAGTPTGFTDLDGLTGGLHDSEFIVLAARPSMGKTALATNIAEHVAIDEGVPVLFVSLEMSRHELAQRLLASQGKIDGIKFRSGMMSHEERAKLVEASARLSKAPLFIDDSPTRTMSEIAAGARRIKRRHGLGLMVVDYLQLIQPDNPKDPRQEQVAKIARRMKGLARELKVPVLCLAQLNRQVEAGTGRESHRPRLSHLRESGAIEQDADVVMFVHREEYYHTREEAEREGILGQGEVFVSKQRNGPTGDIKLAWLHKYTRFENLAHQPYAEFSDYQPDNGEAF